MSYFRRLYIFLLVNNISAFFRNSKVSYPYDPRIHNFGNTGIGGKFHAFLARKITKLIDDSAYGGVNVREKIVQALTDDIYTISDWCCGVGMSTDALTKHFKNADITAVDTSNEMLKVARKSSLKGTKFIMENAEDVTLSKPADLITIMFAFHEIPQHGRLNILKNAKRNLSDNGRLLIVDIDMDYTPSPLMLSGEPYILEYIENVQNDVRSIFPNVEENIVVPGHVRTWYMSK